MHSSRLSPIIHLNPYTELASQHISWSCLHGGLPNQKPPWIHDTASSKCTWWWELGMGIPETALLPQELPLDDHSVICLHSLTRPAFPVITITRGCGCLINPKQPCVVSIVTRRVTMDRTEIFKFDASTHHLRSCSSIHRTLVLRAIDFSRPFIYVQ